MKYCLEWEEWKKVPDELKLNFWNKLEPGVDPKKVLGMALYIPDIIKMIEYLGDDWWKKMDFTGGLKELCNELWRTTLNKLIF